jgi:hypothetical protein
MMKPGSFASMLTGAAFFVVFARSSAKSCSPGSSG